MGNIREELKEFIIENFMLDEELDVFTDEESLVDKGIVDSYGIVEIATFMENHWRFKIKDTEINRENFGSINKMTSFIEGKCNEM